MKTIQATAQSFPTSYTTSGSINGTNYTYCIGKGSNTANSSGNDYAPGSSSTAYIVYSFGDLKIPSGATINSVSVNVKGHLENTSKSTAKLQLYSGSVAKGSESKFSSISDTVVTMTPGTWTADELNNAKLRFTIGYYGGKVVGVTFVVEYTIEKDVYTITASSEVSGMSIEPASADVESGESMAVRVTGASIDGLVLTDNGQEMTLTEKQTASEASYLVESIEGATHGFVLNSSSGFYVSQNKGVKNSAAMARIRLSLPVRCKVTLTYINYAEATYDFGIIGKVDTALTTKYPVSTNSGGDKTIDDGLYALRLNSSSDNSSALKTYDYTIAPGEHFIDVKYGKDGATDSYNDTLQFKVNITPLEEIVVTSYWEYVINNVTTDHTIVLTEKNNDIIAWIRVEGVWKKIDKVYKYIENKWIELNILSIKQDKIIYIVNK